MCFLTMTVKAELHCHNLFSNFNVGDEEPPYDCNVSVRDQLEEAYKKNLQALFVTNHNTLDGYEQLRQYKQDHEKFHNIQVYPAEEITIDTGAHVLAYGIYEEIPSGLTLDEVIDRVKRQDGVTSAPHPFGLLDALRDDAKKCDMIEIFNSNNVDILSNVKAAQFAISNNMTQVAGSDSHVLTTLGRCVNIIDSENTLDDVLYSMKHKRTEINQTGYALQKETLEHLRYKINNSKEYLTEYIGENYPRAQWLLNFLLKIYESNQNSFVWLLIYRLGVFLMKRISHKINFANNDSSFMKERNIVTMFKMAL